VKQSRLISLVEAIANVVVGYGVAVITQVLIFPVFSLQATLAQNLKMGAVFTVVSIARSFALRRMFEALRMRGAKPPPDVDGGSIPTRLPYRRTLSAGGPGSALELVDATPSVDLLGGDLEAEALLQRAGDGPAHRV
jgi:hypothetical protein